MTKLDVITSDMIQSFMELSRKPTISAEEYLKFRTQACLEYQTGLVQTDDIPVQNAGSHIQGYKKPVPPPVITPGTVTPVPPVQYSESVQTKSTQTYEETPVVKKNRFLESIAKIED